MQHVHEISGLVPPQSAQNLNVSSLARTHTSSGTSPVMSFSSRPIPAVRRKVSVRLSAIIARYLEENEHDLQSCSNEPSSAGTSPDNLFLKRYSCRRLWIRPTQSGMAPSRRFSSRKRASRFSSSHNELGIEPSKSLSERYSPRKGRSPLYGWPIESGKLPLSLFELRNRISTRSRGKRVVSKRDKDLFDGHILCQDLPNESSLVTLSGIGPVN